MGRSILRPRRVFSRSCSVIDVCKTGVVHRSSESTAPRLHTWHPTVVVLASGELVAAFDIAPHAESLDYLTCVTRSSDDGQTWSTPEPLFHDPVAGRVTSFARIARVGPHELIATGARAYRRPDTDSLVNRDTLGFVPVELILLRSNDDGRSWTSPEVVTPPLEGPSFEICHAVIVLRDGRWLWPTATWRGWDGYAPNGMKAIALVSTDNGKTWPEYIDVLDQYERGVFSWEQSIVQLRDGRLLQVAWAYIESTGRHEPTPYTISADGRTFSAPRPTGLMGQTTKLHVLADGTILALYRRDDRPGLWANRSRIHGDDWENLEEQLVWDGTPSGMDGQARGADELVDLQMGFPQMVALPDGDVFAVMWCQEDGVRNIRWFRLRLC